MSVNLRLLECFSIQQVRDVPHSLQRVAEVILNIPGRTKPRYIYDPASTQDDDGDLYLEPSEEARGDCKCCEDAGRWVREDLGSGGGGGGGSGPDLSDLDPEDLGAVASPGTSDEASRADHIHSYDGLATDVELASEASARIAGDAATLSDAEDYTDAALLGKASTSHKDTHKTGGSDAFVVTDLLDAVARAIVAKGGTTVGTRRKLNFIEGSGVTLTITDDSGGEKVDITIASSGGLTLAAVLASMGFRVTYSGTLQVGTLEDKFIPKDAFPVAVDVDLLEVYLQDAPVGQDAKFAFYDGITLLGTVTVAAGATYGSLAISTHTVAANSPVTMKITQVGTSTLGTTATGFVRKS